jgi:MFS family permease
MKEKYAEFENKLWTRTFSFTLAMSFFVSMVLNMQLSTIPLYTKHIGGNNSTIGTVTALFTLAAILFRPFIGSLLDLKGRKIILTAGIIIISLSSFSYSFAYTVGILYAIRFLHGVGFSAQSTAVSTIVSDVVPTERLGEGMSYDGIAKTIATAIGPVLGLYLVNHFSYNVFFMICFGFGGIGYIISIFINYEGKRAKTLKESALTKNTVSKGTIIEKSALKPALVLFFMSLTLASVFTFIPSYAEYRGIKDIGIFFTVYALSFLFARTATGKLYDKYGASIVIVPGMISLILALAILAYATTITVFLIAGILYGLGFSAAQPTLNVVLLKLCPKERRGAANATFFSAMDIGVGLGSITWGLVAERLGFYYIYFGSVVCGVTSLIVYMVLLHNKQLADSNNTSLKSVNELI